MRKSNIFYRAIALVVLLASILSILAACENKPQVEEPANKNENLLDISGYSIVRFSNAKSSVRRKTSTLKNSIKDTLGLNLEVTEDWYNPNTPPDPNAKEILIDETNRKETKDALAKLNDDDKNMFVIDITENKIVIVGNTHGATLRAISYFINNYVMPSSQGNNLDISGGKNIVREYTTEKYISDGNKLEMDVDLTSNVIGDPSKNAHFPAVIELQHQPNPEDNGTLIASLSAENKEFRTMGCILKSTDQGKNWEAIYYPTDRFEKSVWAGSMAHIYELPEKLGKYPAGTLIYSANTVRYGNADEGGSDAGYSHIGVWVSTDCGKNWQEISKVATAKGTGEGVWEPYMLYDNGYLYCFYSDDSNPRKDQRIVYKRSKDGINWEAPVLVCAFKDFIDRPGMPIITKLGNGEYFLVYEYVLTGRHSVIYYKTTTDITQWNPSDPGTPIEIKSGETIYYLAAAPSCVWTPAGGEKGTLFVTGQYQIGGLEQSSIFVSYDYGKTWSTIENPLPNGNHQKHVENDMRGYRPIMVLGADPSVIHYINATDAPGDRSIVKYARLKVYE